MGLIIFGALLDEKMVLTRPEAFLGPVVEPVVQLEHEITHVILVELSVNVFNH
jgi:hypothetical protein